MLISELIGSVVLSANVSNGFAWETRDDDCRDFRGKWTNPTGSGSMNLYCRSDSNLWDSPKAAQADHNRRQTVYVSMNLLLSRTHRPEWLLMEFAAAIWSAPFP